MEVEEFDAQRFAALEVVEEGGVGLVVSGGVVLGEVDEVGSVGEDVLSAVVRVGCAVGVEEGEVLVFDGRAFPFALGFEEEGEGVAAGIC